MVTCGASGPRVRAPQSAGGMTAAPAVLALVTEAFGGRGGIAQYNRDFLGSLAESESVSVITVLPRHAPDRLLSPARIEQLPPKPGRIAYALAALRTTFSRSAGIVFCGHLYMAPLAALIARLGGAKLIVQMHGIEAWPRPTRLQRAAVESADLVLCVSRYTRAAVLGWADIAPERVLVVPNTVGEIFTPGDGSSLRKEFGLEDKRVLLTVGRMDASERYKGHDGVIAALPALVANGHDVEYVVVGDGNDVARLKRLAIEAGVEDRV
jgi:phosphatidylinositol alpha-1,6-mannosyltransferase